MRWVLLILAAVARCATPEGDDYHDCMDWYEMVVECES